MIHAGAPQQGANVSFFSSGLDPHIYVVEAVPRQCLSPLLHAEHPPHDRELARYPLPYTICGPEHGARGSTAENANSPAEFSRERTSGRRISGSMNSAAPQFENTQSHRKSVSVRKVRTSASITVTPGSSAHQP